MEIEETKIGELEKSVSYFRTTAGKFPQNSTVLENFLEKNSN